MKMRIVALPLSLFFWAAVIWTGMSISGCGSDKSTSPANKKPVANAGADTSVNANSVILLSAAGSSDDHQITKYQWKIGDGPWLEVSLGDTSIIAPATAQTLVCSLMVTDAGGKDSSDAKTVMVIVPPGMVLIPSHNTSFQMGQGTLAAPVHQVSLTYDFWMDSTEVTQEDYLALMGVNPSGSSGSARLQVETVTWFDAVLYCNARSKRDGLDTVYLFTGISGTPGNGASNLIGLTVDYSKKGYRLPTEAEWEYEARGGKTTAYYWGDSINTEYAWYGANSGNTTHSVGLKTPNDYRMYDMSGNVWEWTNDWFAAYTADAQSDPQGPAGGTYRVMRGGSYASGNSRELRAAYRGGDFPANRNISIGFRCVAAQ